MTPQGEATLAQLGSLPAHVRADYLRILETAVRVAPRGWTRRRGVRLQWITLHGDDDDVVVRVERTGYGELSRYVDWDGPRSHRSLAGAVHHKLGTDQCAALVYGSSVDSRTWGWVVPLLVGAGLPRLDTAVMVDVEHRTGARSTFYFPIEFRRRLIRRLRFEEDVHAILRRARDL
ncbi:hypothetical protein ACRYCC_37835 [Actinomadura scrupuli]|uniref:hypothetical protein n=1 Tax=Actinomadura scrupuli TaxID=559629 RepID=UPI003D95CEFB